MAIKAGKVLRTATAAARKFQHKQFSAANSASTVTPPVTPCSGVGTFLGIPELPRSNTDLLISKYIRLYQNRLTKKGEFTEEKLTTMLSGNVGISETIKLLEGRKTGGDFSSKSNKNK
ncbi:hypothetical protein EUTSA_v10009138mg [Eutrema salsugineum]|uniref:Uncharacterized protein n=1 Tax=Eutrema salsugineum TaxID=72664 RepID=V4L5N2_EUTSA|nr:uncharacterized protein LOC18993143 [Eutrema salsugineum]ESQ35048.1 hypothetical protein EUTSA_v10009138mg [Eutrema salsugineum]